MSTPRLVFLLLIVCGLVVFALQNTDPALALVFFGIRTVALPLSVWLSGAIALGALTTLLLVGFTNLSEPISKRSNRRRWQVRPDAPSDRSSNPSNTGFRDSSRKVQQDSRRPASSPSSFAGQKRPEGNSPKAASRGAAAEDWEAWGARTPARQWEDWTQAGDADPSDRFSKRQRQDRESAENSINDMSKGWDESAHNTIYAVPGSSVVDDTLDEISEGWNDWEEEDTPPAETAYSRRYSGTEAASRRDVVYGPPDDDQEDYQAWQSSSSVEGDRNEDWGLDPEDAEEGQWSEDTAAKNATDADNDSENSEGVYDAEYRVIIPPHRPLNENGNDRDRTA